MFVNFLQRISRSLTLSIFLLGISYFFFLIHRNSLHIWGKLFMCLCVCLHEYVCMNIVSPILSQKILNLEKKSPNCISASRSTWKRIIPFLFQYKVTGIVF